MSQSKLTVRISRELHENLRQYAVSNNTTITQLIETYLQQIPKQVSLKGAPIVQQLIGILPQDVSIDDYKKHIDEKYGNKPNNSDRH
jgi:hypothetical protein